MSPEKDLSNHEIDADTPETPESPPFNPEKDLEKMELFDLSKCNTISDVARGYEGTAFGARMLGEVTNSLHRLAAAGTPAIAIYDGKSDSPLGKTLLDMRKQNMFADIQKSRQYAAANQPKNPIAIIGPFNPEHEKELFAAERTIFINPYSIVRPGQTRDGYFPDVAFDDPNFAVPFIKSALDERLNGKKVTVSEFMNDLEQHEGIGPKIVEGAKILKEMVEDPDCKVCLTLSGAMTIAQMSNVICDMIDSGMVQCVASTGALMAHGLIQGAGLRHFKYNPEIGDLELRKHTLNRVTSVLEPESNFTHIADILDKVLDGFSPDEALSPSILHERIGKYLVEHCPKERGILKSAYEQGIPVFVPAFFDSELGNDFTKHNLQRENNGRKPLTMDLEIDNRRLINFAIRALKLGIFTVGGGVPRNWIQNVAPLIDILNDQLKLGLPESKFSYGVRIAPDKMHVGHLSGCTYQEGKSWGKFAADARTSEIMSDATQIWPLIVRHAMENTRFVEKINERNISIPDKHLQSTSAPERT